MPIDPFAALNAMLRAEATRSGEPVEQPHTAETEGEKAPEPRALAAVDESVA
ncbi:hypothetical protein ACFYT4_31330 [Streptomyces sp. NPDC004609]|uniref:hypothetical protein n=1 Tax=Streptomyces sp. NPDC004609 TaxID=3364704 RepID=UPI003677877B